MQRMQHPRHRYGPRGGHESLGQHLSAEDALQLSVGLPGPKQSDLDLLQVQKVDELGDGLRHARSLVWRLPSGCLDCPSLPANR